MAEHLIDMGRKSEVDAPTMLSEKDRVYYPHNMYLDKSEIEKLGLDGVGIGDELMMMAHVKITSISIHEEDTGENRKNMDVEIQEAKLKPIPTDPASKLFGGS